MRFVSAVVLGLVIVPALIATVSGGPSDSKVAWFDDFDRAMEEAQRRDCVLLVHFYATWCVPCKRMDRDVLYSPELSRLLEAGAVAVKVDGEKHGDLKIRFDVEAYPTDIILSPQGRLLSSSQGYQTRDAYLSTLARTEARYEAIKKQNVARAGTQTPSSKNGSVVNNPQPPRNNTNSSLAIALDGYCPVTLRTTRAWKAGSKDVAYVYQGQTYYLLGQQEADEFTAHPEKYVPKFLGCDPVVLAESAVAVPGDTRWGAYFDGQLFLFESQETRTRFKATPSRYVRSKQPLKASDIRSRNQLDSTTQLSSRDPN